MSLLTLRTSLRLRLHDTDATAANQRYLDASYTDWINRGIERIAVDTMCIEGTTTLIPTGLVSSYQVFGLSAVGATGIQITTAIGIKGIDHSDGLLTLVDIADIRQAAADDEITGDSPEYYAVFGNYVYFDKIPPATLTHNLQVYKSPTSLSGNSDEPDYPIRNHTNLILSAAMLEYAYDLLSEGDQFTCRQAYEQDRPLLSKRVEQRGKHALRRGTRATRLPVAD